MPPPGSSGEFKWDGATGCYLVVDRAEDMFFVVLENSPSGRLHVQVNVKKLIYDAFEKEFSEAFSPLVVNKPGGVFLDNFVLRVTIPTWKPDVPVYALQKKDPVGAFLGKRKAYWPEIKQWVDTSTYQFELLVPGNIIVGPAVVEAELTTIPIPPDQKFSIEKHGLGILEAVTPPAPRKRVTARVAVSA